MSKKTWLETAEDVVCLQNETNDPVIKALCAWYFECKEDLKKSAENVLTHPMGYVPMFNLDGTPNPARTD